jgi:hypothetical protein
MRPGTTLIEIFPYRFDCGDWYEKAAAVSVVSYLKYVPASQNESPGASSAVQNCWKEANGCEGDCLGRLRDQNIVLNLTVFRNIVSKAVE